MIVQYLSNLILGNKTGIYKKSGKALINFDTVEIMDISVDSELPNVPIENGGFAIDSRIERPIQITMTGRKAMRFGLRLNFESFLEKALETLSEAQKGIELFDVQNKFMLYTDYAIAGYRYSVSAAQANVLVVEIDLIEIRQAKPKYFTIGNVKKAANSKTANTGKAPTEAPKEKEKSIWKKITNKKK